jgi:molybdopterin-guanine dinucleotide biosynthesis protein A
VAVGLTGVVLAGGDSQRFGSDKLRFPVDGRSMLARVVEVMTQVADTVVVSARDPGMAARFAGTIPPGVTWLADRPELGGAGPGAGMLTALDRRYAGELLFAPGDMPWVTAKALRSLVQQARERGMTSAAPIWPDGWTEPLVQWQRAAAWKGKVRALPMRGGRGVRPTDLLRGGRAVLLLPVAQLSEDPRCFANINEPGELGRRRADHNVGAGPRPIVRSVVAGRAFWAAASATIREEPDVACASFDEEARRHARSGIAHLELHALEDALGCAREAGRATLPLEERLADVRRRMYTPRPSDRTGPD